MQTRMGDGYMVEMTTDEIRHDIDIAVAEASRKAKCEPLTEDDKQMLMDIICDKRKFVSVERGDELILTYDTPAEKFTRTDIRTSRQQSLKTYETVLMADTLEMSSRFYDFKYIKPYIAEEQAETAALLLETAPLVLYGAMTNLSLYFKPDGPCENAAELMPKGLIKEAMAAQLEAKDLMRDEIVLVGKAMYEAGADGLNYDTTASAGDCDFLGALESCEILKEKYPEMAINIGMSSEFVLGYHGKVKYKGKRLAGMYPHDQAIAIAEAGGNVMGAVVNTNTTKSFAWNLARSVTMSKYCGEVSPIPVHANVGMGVGGVPMQITTPIDCVSRASTAMAVIAKMDGL
jgi:dimethylamine--corrinoid protein Co-methyltransferase